MREIRDHDLISPGGARRRRPKPSERWHHHPRIRTIVADRRFPRHALAVPAPPLASDDRRAGLSRTWRGPDALHGHASAWQCDREPARLTDAPAPGSRDVPGSIARTRPNTLPQWEASASSTLGHRCGHWSGCPSFGVHALAVSRSISCLLRPLCHAPLDLLAASDPTHPPVRLIRIAG